MKKNRIIWIISVVISGFAACHEEQTVIPKPVANLSAEALEGAIVLRWDKPSDPTLLYVLVEYTDPVTQKAVKKTVSTFADSILIDKMLNRYDEIVFNLQTYSQTNDPGEKKQEIKCTALPVQPKINEYVEKIKFSEQDLSANASDPGDEGNLAGLIDGTSDMIYSSRWQDPHETFPHWIQFTLPAPIKDYLRIRTVNRPYYTAAPKEVEILASNDGENWTVIKYFEEGVIPSGDDEVFVSEDIVIDQPYSFLRYSVVSGYEEWFNLAELELFHVRYVIYDPENEG